VEKPFRTNTRLLAMSALMSASPYFRLLPPRPATCSSIASFAVCLCAALVISDIRYGCRPLIVSASLRLQNVTQL
jgi:hypothetical protein